jgi:hypothetical protein
MAQSLSDLQSLDPFSGTTEPPKKLAFVKPGLGVVGIQLENFLHGIECIATAPHAY